MAELLVHAKVHWMELADREKWSKDQIAQFERRTRLGDVICVREDGWGWGGRECPPDYVVIKIPGVPAGALKYLEEPDEDGDVHKGRRRWNIPKTFIKETKALDSKLGVRVVSVLTVSNMLIDKRTNPLGEFDG